MGKHKTERGHMNYKFLRGFSFHFRETAIITHALKRAYDECAERQKLKVGCHAMHIL
jgi:hypothetical protein